MNKYFVIIAVLLGAALAGAYYFFSGKEYIVRITEAEIRESLSQKLPVTESVLFIFNVTLKNPRIELEEGSNRINGGMDIILNIHVDKNPVPLGGSIDISGGLKYVSDESAFYLRDPEVEKLSLQGLPEQHLSSASTAVAKALKIFYEKYPVYSLSSLSAKEVAAKAVLKEVVVQNKEVVVTLGI